MNRLRSQTQPTRAQQRQGDRFTLLRPPKKTQKQKIRDFFWDREKKTCLTRTPVNWLSIAVYYVLFVGGVLLIFFLCMLAALLIAEQKGDRPQYILSESPLGDTPGLNYFPLVDGQSLLWLAENKSYSHYVEAINSVFNSYKKKNSSFDPSNFKDCGSAPFGYDKKTPCIFVRLNRMIQWKPKLYRKGDKLPKDLPDSVKKEIQSGNPQKVWISCAGTTAKDVDHFTDDFFQFQGSPGIDPSAYPFERQSDFLDPIVAIKLVDSNPNKVLYSFTCNAWARKFNSGTASFKVTIYIE